MKICGGLGVEMIKNLRLEKAFEENGGYLKNKNFYELGFSKEDIYYLVKKEYLIRVKRGIYSLNNQIYDETNELRFLELELNSGVICLQSALAIHELSTYTPNEYEVAIDRDKKFKIPDDIYIKLYYFSKKYHSMGIEEITLDNKVVKVYNKEKTICDCIRYRNKLGQDIVSEAIKEYIRKPNKNFALLMEYAKECRVAKILEKYMEVLV